MVVASKACSICMLAHHRIDVMPNMIMIGYLVSRYRDPDHIIASGNCCSQLMMMWDVLYYTIVKGAKLADAVGALAPTDFVVSKSQTYYKFLS